MENSATLDAIQPGGKVRIVTISGDGDIKKRIAEMGLTKGAIIEVERIAPLGDPLDVKVRGYRLSLRKEEAANIVVERL